MTTLMDRAWRDYHYNPSEEKGEGGVEEHKKKKKEERIYHDHWVWGQLNKQKHNVQ